MSLWIAAGDVIAKLLLASDILVLGMVVSASTVTTYVLTGYAARLGVNLHTLAADAVMPGLAGVIGQRSYDRAAILRRELLAMTWLLVTAGGSTVLIWNRSFLHIWVGGENYAGPWVNLLIVLIAVQTGFIRCDSYIIDAALQLRRRVLVSTVAAGLTLALTLVLTRTFGIVGLCLGLLAGRSTQTLWYPVLVRSCLGRDPGLSLGWLLRPLLVMSLLFAGSAYLGGQVLVRHWVTWAAAVALTLGLALGIALAVGLPTELRKAVIARLREVMRRFRSTRGGSSRL
jgi:O-antigen/teichoic acid export membrane protein